MVVAPSQGRGSFQRQVHSYSSDHGSSPSHAIVDARFEQELNRDSRRLIHSTYSTQLDMLFLDTAHVNTLRTI
jgi:hypothetical protein